MAKREAQTTQWPKEKYGQHNVQKKKYRQHNGQKMKYRQHNDQKRERTEGQTIIYKTYT
jgi:hypothetical protein